MTDTATTTEDLEARIAELSERLYADTTAQIAALRQQYGLAAPRAIPATGLIPDVVDGQLIESAWGNAIRDRTVERFDNKAALDAGWTSPANGSVAITVDTGWIWVRQAGVWRPAPGTVLFEGATAIADLNTTSTGLKDVQTCVNPGTYPYPVTVTGEIFGHFGFSTGTCTATPDAVVIYNSSVVTPLPAPVISPAAGFGAAPMSVVFTPTVGAATTYKWRLNITSVGGGTFHTGGTMLTRVRS